MKTQNGMFDGSFCQKGSEQKNLHRFSVKRNVAKYGEKSSFEDLSFYISHIIEMGNVLFRRFDHVLVVVIAGQQGNKCNLVSIMHVHRPALKMKSIKIV